MSYKIERLSANDYEEAIDFLNYVFSFDSVPTNFPVLLPKLYKPTDASMSCNFAVRSNGRIRAIVGLFPMKADVGSRMLKIGGIGGVSTHPSDRGKGYMIALMNECIKTMKEEGYDISCLGGLRQRYNHYGYEKAGVSYNYDIIKNNIRYCFGDNAPYEVTFKPIESSDSNVLSMAREFYEGQPFHCIRPMDEYYSILKSWNMEPFAAFNSDGDMVGYLVSNNEKNCTNEIFARDEEVLKGMLYRWVKDMPKASLSLNIQPWEVETINVLNNISENVNISNSYSWMVFNWCSVIEGLFEVKSLISPALDGTITIGINGAGIFEIDVKGGKASCREVQSEPDFSCDPITAMRLMFGPVPPQYIKNLSRDVYPLLSSWFPLPLGWQHQDGI